LDERLHYAPRHDTTVTVTVTVTMTTIGMLGAA
jgi:hypothetical protein